MEQIIRIADFIFRSFLHIWPYLLLTIPIAVAVKLTGASKYINKALSRNPIISVLLATIVGAFSPFCSCGVIPVITSLLIGGVPLAPVMSFWIASPSMDPEIFFLSSSSLGWRLALWRLSATFLMSLSAGYITHFATVYGFIEKNVLREENNTSQSDRIKSMFKRMLSVFKNDKSSDIQMILIKNEKNRTENICCSVADLQDPSNLPDLNIKSGSPCECSDSCQAEPVSFSSLLFKETWNSTRLVLKYMTLAFFLTSLIQFYIPETIIKGILSNDTPVSVVIATLAGIPAYTSNLTALPLIGGLITLGMNKGAALAFLIAGPVTTLPAMAAVWGIAKPRIFMLYLLFAFSGALLSGLLFNLVNG